MQLRSLQEETGKTSFGRIAPFLSLLTGIAVAIHSQWMCKPVADSTLELVSTLLYVSFGGGYLVNKFSTAWRTSNGKK